VDRRGGPLYHRRVRGRLAPWIIACASCNVQLDGPGAWGTPVAVPGASSGTLEEDDVTLSGDGNEMFFAIEQPAGDKDLYTMTRAGASAAWSAPVALPFNTTETEETPRLSADGRTLYFGSTRPGGVGSGDIWMVMRSGVGASWGSPQLVPGVNTTGYEKWFMPCEANGTYMMVQNRNVGTSTDVVEGKLGGAATVIDVLSSSAGETGTFLTADCLSIYFASTRGKTNDIYWSHRPSLQAPWPAATVVEDFGDGNDESDPWVSADGTMFAFASNKAGTNDIYLCTR
jgi:Tol biopolymer transport system component